MYLPAVKCAYAKKWIYHQSLVKCLISVQKNQRQSDVRLCHMQTSLTKTNHVCNKIKSKNLIDY